jgi:hypothetical protein
LEFLAESLDDLAAEQAKFQYYQKSLQRQQAQIQAFKQKKATEGTTSGLNFLLFFLSSLLLEKNTHKHKTKKRTILYTTLFPLHYDPHAYDIIVI